MQVFVVVRVGYEYNDENYYRSESEGGKPVRVFNVLGDAEKYCKKENIKQFRKLGTPGRYGTELALYDYDTLVDVAFNEDTPDSEIQDVMNKTDVRFFEIHEVEKEFG
jgi:hypothetical protein